MTGDEILLSAKGLTKTFGDFTAVDGIDFAVRKGRGLRLPRPQRRGQVVAPCAWSAACPRSPAASCGSSARTPPPTARRSAPGSACCPQRDTLDEELTVEENLWIYGRYFGLSRTEVRARADRAARLRPAHRARQGQGRAAVRRHEAPPHHRPRRSSTPPRSCSSTSRPPVSTPRRDMCCGTGCSGSSARASRSSLTTHYMDEAEQLCDRLVVMDHGRIVAEGSPRAAHRRALHARGARAALRRRGPQGLRRRGHRRRRARRGAARPAARLRRRRRRSASAVVHARGIEPLSSLVRRSTLEDVFLHLTGRTLVD